MCACVNEKVRDMSNKTKYYLSCIFEQFFLMVTTGAVLQTVLLETGLSPETTNQFTAIQTAVQVGTITVFSVWSDRVRNLIRSTALLSLTHLPFLVFLLLSCYNRNNGSIFLVLLFAFGIVYNIGFGIYTILSLKLPYQIMDMQGYSRVSAITGVVVGIVSLAISGALSWLQARFPFFLLMRVAYAVSILALLIRLAVLFRLKLTHNLAVKNRPAQKFHLLRYKPFSFFIVPNLIRGLCGGLIGMAVSVGYYTGHLNSQSATLLAVITSFVTILGCGVYAVLAGRMTERSILLFASIGVFVFMPLITMFTSTVAFLSFYGLTWFMVVFINYAVPVAVTKIADYDTMGRYSAGRMLLNNAGKMLAGFACVPLFRFIGVQITMFIFAGLQLISGICYYIYMKKNNIR